MNSASTQLIYFSPTRTTKKILEAISRGVQAATVEHLDLTPPGARTGEHQEVHADLALIGAPVYAGRLPAEAAVRLQRLRGNDTPAVIVVVYGNRAYEDALLELRDLALEIGFRPFAAAAFIGEHSYSSISTPIAVGRPDAEDLRRAREFGKRIREKTANMRGRYESSSVQVPGAFPYKERRGLADISPVTDERTCTKCGECAAACPTGAITIAATVATETGLCIRCCACVKNCSTGARTMEDSRIRQVAQQLSINCRERKEPETYLWE